MTPPQRKTRPMIAENQSGPGRPPLDGESATQWIQLRVTRGRKRAYVTASRAQVPPQKLTKWIFDTLDKAAGYTPTSDETEPNKG